MSNPLEMEERPGGLLAVKFTAMACPCEVLLHGSDPTRAMGLAVMAAQEAWRIEHKYSRYRNDSLTGWIHGHRGVKCSLDEETSSLVDFARHCFEMSGGLFDITSGVLRHAWKFDGSDRVPDATTVAALLPSVGFDKVQWNPPDLLLPEGMELDFGGIGKEYAVDCAYAILAAHTSVPFLLNFGGDLRANRRPPQGPWRVGVERPDSQMSAAMLLDLEQGALATSGDSHRFLLKDAIRYSHVLDPRTGWPVAGAPRSVTVAASSCTEAGLLATLAILQGAGAGAFLEEQNVRHWILQ